MAHDNLMHTEGNLTEKELFDSVITLPKNKYPRNDSLIMEFYKFLWHDKKDFYVKNFSHKSIIKLIEEYKKLASNITIGC